MDSSGDGQIDSFSITGHESAQDLLIEPAAGNVERLRFWDARRILLKETFSKISEYEWFRPPTHVTTESYEGPLPP